MMGGGGSQNSTVTQKSDPWAGIQPQLSQAAGDAQKLYNTKGGNPQYNMDAYNKALSAYNSGPKTSSPLDYNSWLAQSGKKTGGEAQSEYNWLKSNNKLGANSTAGKVPSLNDYIIPGTGGASILAPQNFPGQTIADQSPETRAALQLQTQRALSGSPLTRQAQDYTSQALGGGFLGGNPYLDQTFDNASKRITDAYSKGTAAQTDAAFNRAKSYGGSAWQEQTQGNQRALGDSLGQLASDVYGKNYQIERAMMDQASRSAPGMANQDYYDIGQLSGVGDVQNQRSQQSIDDQVRRFNTEQSAPATAIQNYIGLLNGVGGKYGSESTNTPYYQNNTANTMGLLGSLGGMGGMLGSVGTPLYAGFGPGAAISSMAGGSGILGGLGSLGAGLGLFSDVRLKDNIAHVGYEGGFPLYHFTYRDDPDRVTYRGVMAQDVMLIRPDAIEWEGDYMKVNYGKLGIEFGKVH